MEFGVTRPWTNFVTRQLNLFLASPNKLFLPPLKDSDDEQEADYDPEAEGSPTASDDDLIDEDSAEDYEVDNKNGEVVGPVAKRQRLDERSPED